MTTFEITIIVLLVIIAIAVIYGMLILKQTISYNQMVIDENIRKMDAGLDKRLEDITIELNNIEDNILDDLRDIRLADKLSKTSPNVPTPLPCYAPNGICTNPQMDCINCPKRGTGGSWSTTLKAEGEMFQEKFDSNNNKKD